MSGHGEKLTRKQDAAIGALLCQPSITAAAHAVGIAEATLRRWLKEPGFLAAYRVARREALEHCVVLLQKASSAALGALLKSLQAKSEAVRLRAACAVLDYALKGAELLDLETRLAQLEAQVEDRRSR